MKPYKLPVSIKPREFRQGSPIPEPVTEKAKGTPELCKQCNLPESDLVHNCAKLAQLGADKGIDVSDFDCHKFDPLPSGAAPTPDPFSKGYKNRHSDPVSDACGDEKHGECTQDLTKCHCHVRYGHKTMHAYMSPGQHLGAAPGTRELRPAGPSQRAAHHIACHSNMFAGEAFGLRVNKIAAFIDAEFEAAPGIREETPRTVAVEKVDALIATEMSKPSVTSNSMKRNFLAAREVAIQGAVHLSEAQAEVERLRKELEEVIPFSNAPCGHSSQYCWTEDGGKNIVCLVCERERSEASEKAMREALRRVNEEAVALLQTGMGTEHFVAYGETCLTIKHISEYALAAAQANQKEGKHGST